MVAKGQEVRIEQLVFVVPQRLAVAIHHTPTRAFENSLRGRRVPFGSGPEPRVDVGRALGHEADLERAAHRLDLVRPELREVRAELAARMATAADDAWPLGRRAAHANRLRGPVRVLTERADAKSAVVQTLERRCVHDAEHGPM